MNEERIHHLNNPQSDPEVILASDPGPHEDDPALERDYLLLAQLLLDIYRERQREHKNDTDGEIDSSCPTPTI